METSSSRLKAPWIFFFRELTNFKANQRVQEQDTLRGGEAMCGSVAQVSLRVFSFLDLDKRFIESLRTDGLCELVLHQSFTDEACSAAKRRRKC